MLHKDEFKQLTEVGSVARGKSRHRPRNDPQLYGGAYPFVQTGDVKAAPFYLHEFDQTYNEKGLAQSKLWPPGTLCITIAANIADTAILAIPACFPDSIIGFTADPKRSDAKYVKYCLDTYKQRIQAISQGTTQDNLSVEKLLSFRFRIPGCVVQKKIAAVLSAYDDLIENNRRRIALLERMAEQLYREWFVRFRFPGYQHAKFEKGVPSGWRVAKLSELAYVNASSIKKGCEPVSIRYLDIGAVTTNAVEIPAPINYSDAPGRARRRVRHGDVIWSSVRPANRAYGLILEPPENLIASTGFAVISNHPDVPFSFIKYAITTDTFVEQMTAVAKGAAYPATSFDDFENASLLLPISDVLVEFDRLVLPMLTTAHCLARQNEVLKATRDLLLPRLISGKLRVDQLDIQFPPSMQAESA